MNAAGGQPYAIHCHDKRLAAAERSLLDLACAPTPSSGT
jgi:hypothetical protein